MKFEDFWRKKAVKDELLDLRKKSEISFVSAIQFNNTNYWPVHIEVYVVMLLVLICVCKSGASLAHSIEGLPTA